MEAPAAHRPQSLLSPPSFPSLTSAGSSASDEDSCKHTSSLDSHTSNYHASSSETAPEPTSPVDAVHPGFSKNVYKLVQSNRKKEHEVKELRKQVAKLQERNFIIGDLAADLQSRVLELENDNRDLIDENREHDRARRRAESRISSLVGRSSSRASTATPTRTLETPTPRGRHVPSSSLSISSTPQSSHLARRSSLCTSKPASHSPLRIEDIAKPRPLSVASSFAPSSFAPSSPPPVSSTRKRLSNLFGIPPRPPTVLDEEDQSVTHSSPSSPSSPSPSQPSKSHPLGLLSSKLFSPSASYNSHAFAPLGRFAPRGKTREKEPLTPTPESTSGSGSDGSHLVSLSGHLPPRECATSPPPRNVRSPDLNRIWGKAAKAHSEKAAQPPHVRWDEHRLALAQAEERRVREEKRLIELEKERIRSLSRNRAYHPAFDFEAPLVADPSGGRPSHDGGRPLLPPGASPLSRSGSLGTRPSPRSRTPVREREPPRPATSSGTRPKPSGIPRPSPAKPKPLVSAFAPPPPLVTKTPPKSHSHTRTTGDAPRKVARENDVPGTTRRTTHLPLFAFESAVDPAFNGLPSSAPAGQVSRSHAARSNSPPLRPLASTNTNARTFPQSKREAVVYDSSTMGRERSKVRHYGAENKTGRKLDRYQAFCNEVKKSLDDAQYAEFAKHIHRFDAGAIPLTGSRGLLGRVQAVFERALGDDLRGRAKVREMMERFEEVVRG